MQEINIKNTSLNHLEKKILIDIQIGIKLPFIIIGFKEENKRSCVIKKKKKSLITTSLQPLNNNTRCLAVVDW
jgi:hypothetical protein